MKGFPKHINTKKDIYNLIELYPERIKKFLQNSVDGYENWVVVDYKTTENECIEDNTHIYTQEENEEGNIIYSQKEWQVVPGNTLVRIGITKEEAERIISEL